MLAKAGLERLEAILQPVAEMIVLPHMVPSSVTELYIHEWGQHLPKELAFVASGEF